MPWIRLLGLVGATRTQTIVTGHSKVPWQRWVGAGRWCRRGSGRPQCAVTAAVTPLSSARVRALQRNRTKCVCTHVCMCAGVCNPCVHMCECVQVCASVSMCMCVHACMCICVHPCVHGCVHTCASACMCACVYVSICAFVGVHASVSM